MDSHAPQCEVNSLAFSSFHHDHQSCRFWSSPVTLGMALVSSPGLETFSAASSWCDPGSAPQAGMSTRSGGLCIGQESLTLASKRCICCN